MTFRTQSRRTRLRGIRGVLGLTAVLVGLAAVPVGLTAGSIADSVQAGALVGDLDQWNNTGSEVPPS